MKIIIVGCGNVGSAIAEQLSYEGHNITVVDVNEKLVNGVSDAYDVLGVVGNGASLNIQREAGVDNADLLIAVTGADELNLLCCLIARKAGGCHTIARVSNPVYSREIGFIKEELGLSMIINPQMAAAQEIGRLLKFPSALKVDSFAKSRVELVIYKVPEDSALCGVKLRDLSAKVKCNVLIPIVERGEEVMIPDGEFELAAGDEITIVSPAENTIDFFKKMGDPTSVTRDIMMIGGGTTTIYLARQLLNMGVKVKIVEQDPARCEELKELLIEEGLKTVGAFASMTNFDEENIMLTLFAKSLSKAKLFTKVHRISYDEIIESLGVGSVIYPKYITAEEIIKYVRAMKNSIGSNIETLYRLNDNRVEALEFQIREDSPVVGIPLKELNLKKNMIIGCITHKGKVEMPTGNSVIKVNDMVILITTTTGLHDIRDALR